MEEKWIKTMRDLECQRCIQILYKFAFFKFSFVITFVARFLLAVFTRDNLNSNECSVQ